MRSIVIHYAEVGLKGGNRHQFERRLQDRVRQGLKSAGLERKVSHRDRRLVVQAEPGAEQARIIAVATRIPGVAHVMPAMRTEPELEALKAAAVTLLADAPAGTFKVESRRSDKSFPLTSIQVSQAVGSHIADHAHRVADVHTPDITVRVHIGPREAFISAHRIPGPGGLPVGSATHMLGMLSGGLDSPVAIWKMLRRGATVTGVHFHNRTMQGHAVIEKLEDIAGVLAWSAGKLQLLIVPFEPCQRAIVGLVPPAYRMIVYRRAMFRIASRLARQEYALGYITGDSLGQVASQTPENIHTIRAVADLPVYAPLIGDDKVEIVELARRIGTYDISIRPHDDCCSFMISSNPATKTTPEQMDEIEAGLDWDALIDEALERVDRRVIEPDPAVLGA
ncbi:MAG: tRNA uracil 4-sulfurtransferase ThiI [Planctomycetota bacterium]|nr:tRNA uracil 4-sulfurtransferase ThiI [Planctomycetota bacterium]